MNAKFGMAPRAAVGPTIADCSAGVLAPYLRGTVSTVISSDGALSSGQAESLSPLVFASYVLQDLTDYRAALQVWFGAVAPGGALVIVVPHAFLYERQDSLPSRWHSRQRRLYTPRSLAEEVEEALRPNSYRVRWLGDDDAGYDYTLDPSIFPRGAHHVAIVIEKIAPPDWTLDPPSPSREEPPQLAEVTERARIETLQKTDIDRILVLKLDHLGDFVMAIPALERLRAGFPAAHIAIAVGSWNRSLAEETGLFDEIFDVDVYPRNSSEESVDVRGKTSAFRSIIDKSYDLAVDFRLDDDTRFLLENVNAKARAAIGTKIRFPYLDIFCPIDITRHHIEAALDARLPSEGFSASEHCRKTKHAIMYLGRPSAETTETLLFGPYLPLERGDYVFEPYVDFQDDRPGMLLCDVAVDMTSAGYLPLTPGHSPSLAFRVDVDLAYIEFRIHTVINEVAPPFSFYGGRLIRKGRGGVLHHSEYLELLAELIILRARNVGGLKEVV